MADRLRISVSTQGARNFETLAKTFTVSQRRKALRPGARIILEEIRNQAPVGTREHAYYTGRVKGQKKGNGKGQKVRTMKPGNLKRSFTIMTFKRSPDLFVAPRTGKKTPYDGFYAPLVEFGTSKMPAQPFIRPAVASKRNDAQKAIIRRAVEIINGETRKLSRRSA